MAEKATIDPKDYAEFLDLLKSTGEKVDKLTPEEDRRLQNKCWTWIQNNRPKAVMPTLETKTIQILKLKREKKLGKQYIHYRTNEGIVGKEFIHKYAQVPEVIDGKPTGKMIEDKNVVLNTTENLTMEYTKAVGEELVEQALKTAIEPTFYFIQGRWKVKVDAEDFNTDFDEIMKSTLHAVATNRK